MNSFFFFFFLDRAFDLQTYKSKLCKNHTICDNFSFTLPIQLIVRGITGCKINFIDWYDTCPYYHSYEESLLFVDFRKEFKQIKLNVQNEILTHFGSLYDVTQFVNKITKKWSSYLDDICLLGNEGEESDNNNIDNIDNTDPNKKNSKKSTISNSSNSEYFETDVWFNPLKLKIPLDDKNDINNISLLLQFLHNVPEPSNKKQIDHTLTLLEYIRFRITNAFDEKRFIVNNTANISKFWSERFNVSSTPNLDFCDNVTPSGPNADLSLESIVIYDTKGTKQLLVGDIIYLKDDIIAKIMNIGLVTEQKMDSKHNIIEVLMNNGDIIKSCCSNIVYLINPIFDKHVPIGVKI